MSRRPAQDRPTDARIARTDAPRRAPMYLGGALTMLGELIRVPSWAFAGYITFWFAVIWLLVVAYEEPTLRSRFGESYARYTRHVRRWIPRRRPYRGG